MKKETRLPIIAIIFFGIYIILSVNNILLNDVFAGLAFIVLGAHRRLYNKDKDFSNAIPVALTMLGVYFVVMGILNMTA